MEKKIKFVLKIIDYVINKYRGKAEDVIFKHGNQIFLSYKYQMVHHIARVFDKYFVLKSLPSS